MTNFKRFKVISMLSLALIPMMPCSVLAQDASDNQRQIVDLYANYASNQYAIELPFNEATAERLRSQTQFDQPRIIYIPATSLREPKSPLLRIGFFDTEAAARSLMEANGFTVNEQKIVQIPQLEHSAVSVKLTEATDSAVDDEFFILPISTNLNDPLANSLSVILGQARDLYAWHRFEEAAALYNLLSLIADDTTAAWAKELYGLSQERLGNQDLAIKAYEEVLTDFPNAAGITRVDQRLRGLQTAASDGQSALRDVSATDADGRFSNRGVVGQYYRTLSRSVDGGGSDEVMSVLTTDFDFRTSAQWDGHDLQARINGFWLKDNLDSDDTDLRLKRVFVDYRHEATGTSVTLGRQREFDSGVYTSFDGLSISYPIKDNLNISASTGKPIYFADVYEDIDYYFNSANLKWNINENWQLNSYYIEQTLNDVTDREAIGIGARYSNPRLITSLNVDYDIAFSELNNLLWNTSFQITEGVNLSAIVGKQHSPFLTASNILIGQADMDLELYLKSKENTDTLLDDALARTSLNEYYSLALNAKLNDKLSLYANFYQSDLSEIPSTALLLGLENNQDPELAKQLAFSQRSYDAQLVIQSLFHRTESTAIGIRRTDGSNSTSNQVFIRERLRFGSKFTLAPNLTYSDVQFSNSSESQKRLRYSFMLNYRPIRSTEFSLELGNESIDTRLGNRSFESTYVFVGYRYIF